MPDCLPMIGKNPTATRQCGDKSMEEVAEGVIRSVFRILKWILVEALFEVVFYWLGRIFLLIVTFGRYPRGTIANQHEGRISATGAFLFIAGLVLLALLNSNSA